MSKDISTRRIRLTALKTKDLATESTRHRGVEDQAFILLTRTQLADINVGFSNMFLCML